jgi:hypothetical protein
LPEEAVMDFPWVIVLLFVIILLVILFGTGVLG